MERVARDVDAAFDAPLERLSDVIWMHMMYGLKTEVRKDHFLAESKLFPHTEIGVADRVDDGPSWTGDVTGTKRDGGKATRRPRLGAEEPLNLQLVDAVIAPGG